jgi:hypothetical protein
MHILYLLFDQERPHIKIGHTKNLHQRVKNLPESINTYRSSFFRVTEKTARMAELGVHRTFHDPQTQREHHELCKKGNGWTEWYHADRYEEILFYLNQYFDLGDRYDVDPWPKISDYLHLELAKATHEKIRDFLIYLMPILSLPQQQHSVKKSGAEFTIWFRQYVNAPFTLTLLSPIPVYMYCQDVFRSAMIEIRHIVDYNDTIKQYERTEDHWITVDFSEVRPEQNTTFLGGCSWMNFRTGQDQKGLLRLWKLLCHVSMRKDRSLPIFYLEDRQALAENTEIFQAEEGDGKLNISENTQIHIEQTIIQLFQQTLEYYAGPGPEFKEIGLPQEI